MLSAKDYQKTVYDFFLSKGFLVSPSFLQCISEDFDIDEFYLKLKRYTPVPFVLTDELFLKINEEKKEFTEEKKQEVEIISFDISREPRVVVVKNYTEKNKKKEVMDFVNYYRARYNAIKNILINRQELQNAVSINRILQRTEKDFVALIGIVKEKKISKNGNIILVLEDLTGTISVVINKNKQEFFSLSQDILLDEIIGVSGVNSDKVVFANEIILPEIPINNELKKSDVEEYVVFTSDLHVGSKMFFETNFLKFISWINGEYGSDEHKTLAKKVKYLFIGGDLVEGVGIYPGQEGDLVIKDVYEQYSKLTDYISKIRKDLPIIVIGGNHDALRLSEPQPPIDPKMAPSLYELKNITFVTNPSVVNIGSTELFSGFNVLLYHGGSFPYLSENVDSIRRNGRLNRPDLIMKYLLQRRHLSVSHTSTLYVPGDEDFLVIDKVPDFFISGHIHKTILNSYRNVTLAACGCWTGQTDDQARRGIVPDPNRIILVNLQTREPKILNFEE
ncbi:metallophosphoesterase [Candidatus Woesearchaeota archaeon]|nr:metallophosphoesterase [Candidatus Woesearchaeota archaeon]